MWITGLIIGPLAIIIGILLLVFGRGAADFFNSATMQADSQFGRFTPGKLVVPAIAAIGIGTVFFIAGFFKSQGG
ncbi:hypothetical protein DEI86_07145 [Curtobacterium sp. MCBD17_028]|nr:hypothetical protein DEI86_07145 [Curtobacterium sp. MCBD17_028]